MEKQKAVLVRGDIICAEEVTWFEKSNIMPIVVGASEEDIAKCDIITEFGGDVRCDKDMIAHGVEHGMVLVTGAVRAVAKDWETTVKSVGECVGC